MEGSGRCQRDLKVKCFCRWRELTPPLQMNPFCDHVSVINGHGERKRSERGSYLCVGPACHLWWEPRSFGSCSGSALWAFLRDRRAALYTGTEPLRSGVGGLTGAGGASSLPLRSSNEPGLFSGVMRARWAELICRSAPHIRYLTPPGWGRREDTWPPWRNSHTHTHSVLYTHCGYTHTHTHTHTHTPCTVHSLWIHTHAHPQCTVHSLWIHTHTPCTVDTVDTHTHTHRALYTHCGYTHTHTHTHTPCTVDTVDTNTRTHTHSALLYIHCGYTHTHRALYTHSGWMDTHTPCTVHSLWIQTHTHTVHYCTPLWMDGYTHQTHTQRQPQHRCGELYLFFT